MTLQNQGEASLFENLFKEGSEKMTFGITHFDDHRL